jgi:hypothetical protein
VRGGLAATGTYPDGGKLGQIPDHTGSEGRAREGQRLGRAVGLTRHEGLSDREPGVGCLT